MSIFAKLGTFFTDEEGSNDSQASNNIDAKKLAAAALMVEVAVQDGEFADQEQKVIKKSLIEKLDLSDTEAEELLSAAIDKQSQSIQILSFTRDIKNHFDEEGRADIMEMLWGIVFADGVEDHFESNLMRRIAGLLYVSDKKSGELRKKIMRENNLI
ncbi:MAG: TerB family tellurite resistance protein [Kordiimonadaceae bacterium]|nr:TerB family tellurite resistance protein [Kordiimonadaceae bacterium]MBT6031416.1 TerB family tellurite resistance protein [Kordiimonadaceae bacterium]